MPLVGGATALGKLRCFAAAVRSVSSRGTSLTGSLATAAEVPNDDTLPTTLRGNNLAIAVRSASSEGTYFIGTLTAES